MDDVLAIKTKTAHTCVQKNANPKGRNTKAVKAQASKQARGTW
jgi:hypothetical protein